MASKPGQRPTPPKTPRNHLHVFTAFPSDPRFERCACGATLRADRDALNPCVQRWGAGPAGATCRECAHLRSVTEARTYYKCEERADLSHSAATDQHLAWPACARFTPRAGSAQFTPRAATDALAIATARIERALGEALGEALGAPDERVNAQMDTRIVGVHTGALEDAAALMRADLRRAAQTERGKRR